METPTGPNTITTTGNGATLTTESVEGRAMTMVDVEGAEAHLQTKVRRASLLTLESLVIFIICAAGRKRRRSISPYERERYEPRPRHNDDFGLDSHV